MNVSKKVINAARNDYVMRYRLAGINDLVAADCKYHLQCYTEFMRKMEGEKISCDNPDPRDLCLGTLGHEISIGVTKGEIYSLLDVWKRYCALLAEFQIEAGSYKENKKGFKEKLQHLLQGNIEFVSQIDPHEPQILFPTVPTKIVVQALKETKDELGAMVEPGLCSSQFINEDAAKLLTLHHAALQIRADIKDLSCYDNCATVNIEDTTHIVPQSLYLFLSVLLTGDTQVGQAEDVDAATRRLALSFAQDIVHAVTKGKTLTPKHVGLGMTIHQATRSRTLVDILHKAGHSISYNQVRRVDTTLAMRTLDKYIKGE